MTKSYFFFVLLMAIHMVKKNQKYLYNIYFLNRNNFKKYALGPFYLNIMENSNIFQIKISVCVTYYEN